MIVSLEGKVTIVTGGAAGLGRASSLAFADAGASVVVADIDVAGGEETVDMIRRNGGQAIFTETDISKETEVQNLVAKAVEAYGKLDCAHNNAGIAARGPLVNISEEEWDRLISINLKGTWLCMKHELVQMVKQGSGAIVNTSSITGLIGAPNSCLYATSKWGINGMTKSAAMEYAKSGIRINSICPGGIKGTKMWLDGFSRDPERAARLTQMTPMGRDATPEEIANAAVWLCSEAASYITGCNLPVDGGKSAS